MNSSLSLDRRGLIASISAYVMWGVFPLYWHLLRSVPALQIIAHRMLWCGVFVVGYLLVTQGTLWLRLAASQTRVLLLLLLCSVLISSNWGIYIWAVTHGRVIDASLGYFINPLVNVLIGVLVLHERLNRNQWLAIAIAFVGVLWLAWQYGQPPWIALFLAVSFALYGLIRKKLAIDALPGLAIESLILFVPAVSWLLWSQAQGVGAFSNGPQTIDVLLVTGGMLTALPLIGYAYGVRRIPYSLVGILQYISPTLQLLIGALILGEVFTFNQAIGFACIWLALAIYAVDGWQRSRQR